MWSLTQNGPQVFNKTLTTIPWTENRDNFPLSVARSIDDLTRLDNPEQLAGRVVLWHGEPGTGKTSAIRSLIHEWKDWCTAHCVIDPDRFFDDPTYIAQILTCPDKKRWKLVVAEDCDEYISQRPGGVVSGSLGRLLNLTDGLFGQSSNTIVLLTTNSSIGRLHPAITRPGRCLSTIEFVKLNRAEVGLRTGQRNSPSMTLAELYQVERGGSMPRIDLGNHGYV
jgi:SpoVK/Ycf46/Vps4 family AAA+-type ATPase